MSVPTAPGHPSPRIARNASAVAITKPCRFHLSMMGTAAGLCPDAVRMHVMRHRGCVVMNAWREAQHLWHASAYGPRRRRLQCALQYGAVGSRKPARPAKAEGRQELPWRCVQESRRCVHRLPGVLEGSACDQLFRFRGSLVLNCAEGSSVERVSDAGGAPLRGWVCADL